MARTQQLSKERYVSQSLLGDKIITHGLTERGSQAGHVGLTDYPSKK